MKNVMYCSKNRIKIEWNSKVWELLQRCQRNNENPSKINSYIFQASLLFPSLLAEQTNQERALLRNVRHMFQLKMVPSFPTFIKFLRKKNPQPDLPHVVIWSTWNNQFQYVIICRVIYWQMHTRLSTIWISCFYKNFTLSQRSLIYKDLRDIRLQI